MFSNQSAEVSLNRPIAAIDALKGDKVNSRFVAGTSSAKASEDNHLVLLRYHSEANHLGIDGRLSHPSGAVSNIQTSSSDPSYLLTTSENNAGSATLWKVPSDVMDRLPSEPDEDLDEDDYYDHDDPSSVGSDHDKVSDMEEKASLSVESGSAITDLVWRGSTWEDEDLSGGSSSTMGDVATLSSDGCLTQWDVAFGSAESTRQCSLSECKSPWNLPSRMAWDPHQSDVLSVSTGTMVRLVDWRESQSSFSIGSHRYGITDLDYNPNKPNVLVTSGKDGLLKFWDLRKTGSGHYETSQDVSKKQRPLLVARGGHRHWASRVLYNPFHDQLVLSAGTDSLVNLWRMSTISSAPLLTLDDDRKSSGEDTKEGPNIMVSKYEHIDSVKSIVWGSVDAWIYLSASYDGKVVLNHVPSQEKYKILL